MDLAEVAKKGASLVSAMEEAITDRYKQLAERAAEYVGRKLLGRRGVVYVSFTEGGMEVTGCRAASFVEALGALMTGSLNKERDTGKFNGLTHPKSQAKELRNVVGAVLYPLLEVLAGAEGVYRPNVVYEMKGRDLMKYKYRWPVRPYSKLSAEFEAPMIGWVKLLPVPRTSPTTVGITLGQRTARKNARVPERLVEPELAMDKALQRWIALYNYERECKFEYLDYLLEVEDEKWEMYRKKEKLREKYKEVVSEKKMLKRENEDLQRQLADLKR